MPDKAWVSPQAAVGFSNLAKKGLKCMAFSVFPLAKFENDIGEACATRCGVASWQEDGYEKLTA